MNKLGFTISELAEVGPFGRTTLYKLCNTGLLRAKKYGDKTIVTPEDFKALLDSLPDYPVKEGAA
jgi:hypothetical protein